MRIRADVNIVEARLSEFRLTEIPYYPRCFELYYKFNFFEVLTLRVGV